jgi:hypothetical protein
VDDEEASGIACVDVPAYDAESGEAPAKKKECRAVSLVEVEKTWPGLAVASLSPVIVSNKKTWRKPNYNFYVDTHGFHEAVTKHPTLMGTLVADLFADFCGNYLVAPQAKVVAYPPGELATPHACTVVVQLTLQEHVRVDEENPGEILSTVFESLREGVLETLGMA